MYKREEESLDLKSNFKKESKMFENEVVDVFSLKFKM